MTKNRTDITLFISRLIIGGIFVLAGWTKVADMANTVAMFGAMDIPAFWAYVVGYGELLAGILLVVGLWIDRASAFLAIIMIFAVYYTYPMGFQAFGMPLAVFAGLLAFIGCGGGKYKIKG